MLYQLHSNTRSDGCAPDTGRVSFKPTQHRNYLARAIAFILMSGTVTLPVSAWAARIEGYKFNDLNNNKVMDANEFTEIEAMLDILQKLDGKEIAQMWVMAATVELLEPSLP